MFSLVYFIFRALVTISSLRLVIPAVLDDIQVVCNQGLSETKLRALANLAKDQQNIDDCQHSTGFHLTEEFCKSAGFNVNGKMPKALTTYSSGEDTVVYVTPTVDSYSSQVPENKTISFKAIFLNLFEDKHHLVIWIKESFFGSPHHYVISYKKGSSEGQTHVMNNSVRFDEQIILEDFRNARQLTVSFKHEKLDRVGQMSFDINNSYYILCLKNEKSKTRAKYSSENNCGPRIEDERVHCECNPDMQLLTILFFFSLWGVTVLLIVKPMVSLLLDTQKKDKTDIALNVNCNPKNARYVYVIFLRLAKSSPDFDLHEVSVDIQFFAENNEPIGELKNF